MQPAVGEQALRILSLQIMLKACAECITNIAIPSIIKLNLILRNTCKVSAQQSIEQPISLLQKLWKSIVNLTWKKSMTKVDFYIPTNDSV